MCSYAVDLYMSQKFNKLQYMYVKQDFKTQSSLLCKPKADPCDRFTNVL